MHPKKHSTLGLPRTLLTLLGLSIVLSSILLSRLDGDAFSPQQEAPPSCVDKELLFVAGATPLSTDESLLVNRLTTKGFGVTVLDQATATVLDAEAVDLVLISESIAVGVINTLFRDVAVPVMTWDAFLYPRMGMVGSEQGTDYGIAANRTTTTIDSNASPLTAGLTGTITTHSDSSSFHWGQPEDTAIKVAFVNNNSNRYAIFAYEAGVEMSGLVAPARRIAFHSTTLLTAEGFSLFDAAVGWGANCAISDNQPSDGPFLLTLETEGEGSVVADPAQPDYAPGDVIVLEAQPAEGWVFGQWVGETVTDLNPTVVVFLDQDIEVKAVFVPVEPTPIPDTPTFTPTAIVTPTATLTATAVLTPTAILTPTFTPTFTPVMTPTLTPLPSETFTPTLTPLPVPPTPTFVPTETPPMTPTLSATVVPTPFPTLTVVPTALPTLTNTPTPLPTMTPRPASLAILLGDTLLVDINGDGQTDPGDTIRYTATLRNAGESAAPGLSFEVPVGPYLTVLPDSIQIVQGSILSGGQAGDATILINVGTLDGGQTVEITFDVTIGRALPIEVITVEVQGILSDNSGAQQKTDDPDTTADADATITVIPSSVKIVVANDDLLLIDADNDGLFSVGDTLLYVISVQNLGNRSVSNARLESTLGEHIRLNSGSVTADGIVIGGNQAGDESVVVDFALLETDTSPYEVRFQAKITGIDEGNQIQNQAILSYETVGGASGNTQIKSDDPRTTRAGDPTITELGTSIFSLCQRPLCLYLPVVQQ